MVSREDNFVYFGDIAVQYWLVAFPLNYFNLSITYSIANIKPTGIVPC